LAGEIEQPARRTDDDVHATLERFELWLVGPAAVDHEDPGAPRAAREVDVACHLAGELAGRDDDERLRLSALGLRGDLLQDRDGEREGLAGPGAGLADEVVTLDRQRYGEGLDRERAGDAMAGEGLDDVVGDA
jgi:hypothetical protein